MALYRYFKVEKGGLPDPHGPLAKIVPSSSIAAANSEVQAARESSLPDRKKRGSYAKYTPEQKALIAKRAAEHGVVATIRHYAKEFPKLKDTTVRDWRDAYRLELKRKGKESSNVKEVKELPEKKEAVHCS